MHTVYAHVLVCLHSVWLDRGIKRAQFQNPLIEMTKADIERDNLGEWVVMPERFGGDPRMHGNVKGSVPA